MTLSIQTCQITLSVNTKYRQALDLGNADDILNFSRTETWTNGNGNAQANRVFHDTRTVASASNDDLDLVGSALTDALGQDVSWTKLKGIYINNLSGEDLKLESSTSPTGLFGASGDFINIPPYSMFLLTNAIAGWALTGGSADVLRIANYNSTAAANYEIVLLGAA